MRHFTLVTVTALLLAACTSGSSDSSSGDDTTATATAAVPASPTAAESTTPPPTGPECVDVWAAGRTLPADYDQCVTNGVFGPQDVIPCEDGSKLVTFDDSLYAVTGGRIVEPSASPLQDTDEYGAAYADCTGE